MLNSDDLITWQGKVAAFYILYLGQIQSRRYNYGSSGECHRRDYFHIFSPQIISAHGCESKPPLITMEEEEGRSVATPEQCFYASFKIYLSDSRKNSVCESEDSGISYDLFCQIK